VNVPVISDFQRTAPQLNDGTQDAFMDAESECGS